MYHHIGNHCPRCGLNFPQYQEEKRAEKRALEERFEKQYADQLASMRKKQFWGIFRSTAASIYIVLLIALSLSFYMFTIRAGGIAQALLFLRSQGLDTLTVYPALAVFVPLLLSLAVAASGSESQGGEERALWEKFSAGEGSS